jgi:polysaccharide biosynthesis protein PslA
MSVYGPTPRAEQAESFSLNPVSQSSRYSSRNFALALTAIGVFAVVLMALSMAIGGAYFAYAYNGWQPMYDFAAGGAIVAVFYALPFMIRGEFTIYGYASGQRSSADVVLGWNSAFLALACLAFLTKMTGSFSRVWVVAFYLLGLATMLVLEVGVRRVVIYGLKTGRIASRRLMLVGAEREIRMFNERLATLVPLAERLAVKIIALAVLPSDILARDTGELSATGVGSLDVAVANARRHLPDDIVLLLSWDAPQAVSACVDAFSVLPVAVHLDGGSILEQARDGRVRRFGAANALALTPRPPSTVSLAMKRIADIVGAGAGLVLLSPLLVAIAVAVRYETKGPALFFQDRRGFNQRTFKIWKFRSMTTLDNGAEIEQARKGDERITRVGQWLRQTNLDELPQLFNVLRGDMSLVGPRPHAVAHDKDFEARIPRYQRRLNMRPGITGWAQVNGFRGETDTDDKMRRRVEHDVYYIDHWSMAFDAYILLLTFMSQRTHRNAR